jgi:hypothetical protein
MGGRRSGIFILGVSHAYLRHRVDIGGLLGAWRKMKTSKPVNMEKPEPEADQAEIRDAMERQVTQRKSEVRLGREVQARIGQQLRAMYDEVVKEGVPQHIGDLVRRLSDQDDGAA